MKLHRYLELRRLRHDYVALKAENDKVFWNIHDSLPESRDWKSRVRRTIEITRVGDEFQEQRELFRRIVSITGRAVV